MTSIYNESIQRNRGLGQLARTIDIWTSDLRFEQIWTVLKENNDILGMRKVRGYGVLFGRGAIVGGEAVAPSNKYSRILAVFEGWDLRIWDEESL